MEPFQIGKYTVVERIGGGSMSEVFKAFDPTLNRFVALKSVPHSKAVAEDVRKRFYREAQSAAGLNHPNIITVYELGEDGGRLFIAMELLEGRDLKDLIGSRVRLSLDEKLDLMEQIAEGVGFAHSRWIVHRDLKPGNIHVEHMGRVKIMDFGLARLLSSNITRSGLVMGTPSYMSPEQVRGERVDTSSDVFSMGAILYELLSFKKPFQGASLHETMLSVLQGKREPLSQVAPDVPEGLVRIVDRALALAPEGRYPNGYAVLEVLRSFRRELRLGEGPPATAAWVSAPVEEEAPSDAGLGPMPAASAPTRSLTGSLRGMHIADLLQFCAIKKKTGTLRVRHGPIEKRLYFREGQLFSSTSNSPREVLGQILIRSGQINEGELFEALVEQEHSKEPLGWILITKGLLGEAELKRLLQLKCEESIYDCFLWTDGDFEFEEHRIPEKVPVSFCLDISRVIQEGIHRMNRWEVIRKRFPSRLTTFVVCEAARDKLGGEEPSDEQRRIVELVDAGRNLAEIALELHAVDYYAASRLLELCEKGWIQVDKVPEELPYEQQVQELRDRLAEGLRSFQQGDHSKALHAFEKALELDPHSSKASVYVDKITSAIEELESVRRVPREGIPRVKIPVEELEKLSLAPQEGFVLSRMGGDWDIRSILKICPMTEMEVLKIIKGFLDRGVIEIHSGAGIITEGPTRRRGTHS